MKFKDYYETLGVSEDASADAIKKAYRKRAREVHPDLNREEAAGERFKEVGEAYEVLKDPAKREEYDQLRKYGGATAGEEFTPPPEWQSRADFRSGGYTTADSAEFSDFFETLFGRGAARSAPGGGRPGGGRPGGAPFAIRGEDIHYRIPIALDESYRGSSRAISLQTHRFDDQGRVVPETRTLNVKIPKGVVQGQKIRLRGQGGAGYGGAPNGDLYMEVDLEPHPMFTVADRDVSLVLPVAPWEAALGATVKVPTLGGPVNLAIPAGAVAGQRLRLKGRGLPGSVAGDQYVVLKIVLPPMDSDEDRALMEKMRAQMPFNPRETLGV